MKEPQENLKFIRIADLTCQLERYKEALLRCVEQRNWYMNAYHLTIAEKNKLTELNKRWEQVSDEELDVLLFPEGKQT